MGSVTSHTHTVHGQLCKFWHAVGADVVENKQQMTWKGHLMTSPPLFLTKILPVFLWVSVAMSWTVNMCGMMSR